MPVPSKSAVKTAFKPIRPPVVTQKAAPKPTVQSPFEPAGPITVLIRFQLVCEPNRPNFGYAYYTKVDEQNRTITIALNTHFEIVAEAIEAHNFRVVAWLIGVLLGERMLRQWPKPLRLLREHLNTEWHAEPGTGAKPKSDYSRPGCGLRRFS